MLSAPLFYTLYGGKYEHQKIADFTFLWTLQFAGICPVWEYDASC